jgi:hypothetical protein
MLNLEQATAHLLSILVRSSRRTRLLEWIQHYLVGMGRTLDWWSGDQY